MRNIPIAGAAIGASTNAATLYAVGYAACRFYEAKLSSTSEVAIAAALAESEAYIQEAAVQQMIMDQILAHVVLSGHPGKTWQQILPELETLNFSPASIQVIASKATPTPLPELLDRINQDFATSLMAQCQKLAQLDGVTTPAEAAMIREIARKFATDADLVEQLQQAETPSGSQNNLFSFMQKISLTP